MGPREEAAEAGDRGCRCRSREGLACNSGKKDGVKRPCSSVSRSVGLARREPVDVDFGERATAGRVGRRELDADPASRPTSDELSTIEADAEAETEGEAEEGGEEEEEEAAEAEAEAAVEATAGAGEAGEAGEIARTAAPVLVSGSGSVSALVVEGEREGEVKEVPAGSVPVPRFSDESESEAGSCRAGPTAG